MSERVREPLGDLSGLGEGELRPCRAGHLDVFVCRVEGRLYAIRDQCSHAETTLSDGVLEGYVVTCPLHFAQFDVRDGHHLGPPAFTGVASYPVEETADGASIQVPGPDGPAPGGEVGGRFRTR